MLLLMIGKLLTKLKKTTQSPGFPLVFHIPLHFFQRQTLPPLLRLPPMAPTGQIFGMAVTIPSLPDV